MGYGVVFTQQGVAVAHSSDYQKVIDSRWRFMEIEREDDISIILPANNGVDSSRRYYEKTVVYRHNLGFFPAFEANVSDASVVGIFADKNTIFLRRLITTSGDVQRTVIGSFRLYNLPILEDYEAPKEVVSGASAPKTTFGIKFVDGSVPNVSPADNGVQGFSVDTTKKILSVHKSGPKTFTETDNTITHGVGYPPTYLLAPVNKDEITSGLGTDTYMEPLVLGVPDAIVRADSKNLTFRGVQAVFTGDYGYIILKDPTEIAQ